MERVRGTALDELLRAAGPMSLERVVPLVDRLCEVVQTADEQSIVHRDIKPANVMVRRTLGMGLSLPDSSPSRREARSPA
jgi:serine/threonine-protein kinase